MTRTPTTAAKPATKRAAKPAVKPKAERKDTTAAATAAATGTPTMRPSRSCGPTPASASELIGTSSPTGTWLGIWSATSI